MTFLSLLKFELLHSLRRYNDLTTPLWFLLLSVCIFSLSLQHDYSLLQKAAPGIIWSSVLLAIMLSMNQIFLPDYHSGMLEHMMLSTVPLTLIIWIKVIAHWLKTCLPLLLCVPLIGMLLHLPFQQTKIIILSLFLATPSLTLLGALGAALTLRLSNQVLLLFLLILPLCIPFLIFGLSINDFAILNLSIITPLCLLCALLILSFALLPLVIAFALRIGINN